MVRCFYGSSRPNHDGDFPPSSDDSAARWGGSTDGHPSHPHRRDISDAGSHWNGPKPSDIGCINNSPIRRRRRHDAPALTNKGKASLHIIPPSPPHGAPGFIWMSPRGQRKSSLSQPSKGRHQAAIDTQEKLPITHSTDDKGWIQLLHTVTPPPREGSLRSRAADNSPNSWIDAAPHRPSLDLPSLAEWKERAQQKKGGIPAKTQHNAVWSYDDKDTTKMRRGRLITQFTSPYQKLMSKAQQQFTLLRRCFYPRRDVIKWTGRLFGLSCEVHTVQEPLTRLPCGASSTCVELPYTTILWFGVSLEDLDPASSLPLGEHVPYLVCTSVSRGPLPRQI